MSIPKRDPDYTTERLEAVARRFLAVGQEYWEALHKAGIGGAIAWYEDTNKGLVIFTRGEYREMLLKGIPQIGPIHQFGSVDDGSEG